MTFLGKHPGNTPSLCHPLKLWVGNCGVQLQPLVDALRDAVLTQGVVHADETPVKNIGAWCEENSALNESNWSVLTRVLSPLEAQNHSVDMRRAVAFPAARHTSCSWPCQ